MTTDPFSVYFLNATEHELTDGVTQNDFSVQYTAWLKTILENDAADWLADQNLTIVGDYTVKLNQNSEDGAPYIEYFDGATTQTFSLEELFTTNKDDLIVKTGKVTQERFYYDTFTVPGADVNDAPTDIHLTIDPDFAAAVAGAGGKPTDAANTTTGDGPLVIGLLAAVDPDAGDTHSFEIVDDPTGRFVLDGDKLMLGNGDSIDQADDVDSFTVTIKVTDSGGLSYYETFTFTAGTDEANSVAGTDTSGDGTTEATAVLGDDIEFGFVQNDPLNGSSGDDALFGGRGTDTLNGGDGDDQLFGGFNEETLIGGMGDDVLQGDHGTDTFVFDLGADDGDDTISDFARAEDILKFTDVVDVGAAGLTFEDVDAAISGFGNGGLGGDVTVNFNNGASITLVGAGTAGVIDSIADLVDNAAAQIVVV